MLFGPEFWPESTRLRPRRLQSGGMYIPTDKQMDGCKEIHPCVLQDIGPLGLHPKNVT